MAIALVTGGAGFIGSHLVDTLLEGGVDVRVLDNLSTGSLRNLQAGAERSPASGRPGRRIELMVGDVRDDKLARKAMRHVDCVYHLAGLPPGTTAGGHGEVHTVNVQGTLNVLQAAATEGVRRVVFASCASIYGSTDGNPVTEDRPALPVSVFGASKLAGEIYCRAYHASRHVETVLLRYFNVYGPRQNAVLHGAFVPALIETLRRGRRPILTGDGRVGQDFLFVDDAVAATVAAARSPRAAGAAINIGSGQLTSPVEMLGILNRLLRADVVPRQGRPRSEPSAPARAGVALAADLLGWAPRVSVVSGLAHTVQFFAEAEQHDEGLLAEVGSHEERADF
ncbi:MAG TPA: NAD-dependent epimerase/dehydratase family protein [Methylomirabilota bacterium]|nr:NAD-dependent epimerase/dehydratase family protein [Methylomirabilota bacterium]